MSRTRMLCAVFAIAACSRAAPEDALGRAAFDVSAADYSVQIPPAQTPWQVILCKPNDAVIDPNQDVAFYTRLFTTAGSGTSNVVDFWKEQSAGALDLSGTTVLQQWFTIDKSTAQMTSEGDLQNMADCHDAAGDAYDRNAWGHAFVFGAQLFDTHGGFSTVPGVPGMASGPIHWACLDSAAPPSTIEHEMGHAYTLDHSYNDLGQVYGDPYDTMSVNVGVKSFPTSYCVFQNGCNAGPALNLWNRWLLGWVPAGRRLFAAAPLASPMTFTLAARSHPEVYAPLMAFVQANASFGYTVELAVPDGFDRGVPYPTLLIHKIAAGDEHSYFVTEQGGAQIDPASMGAIGFVDAANDLVIRAVQLGKTSAVVQIEPIALPSCQAQLSCNNLWTGQPSMTVTCSGAADFYRNFANGAQGYIVKNAASATVATGFANDAILACQPGTDSPSSCVQFSLNTTGTPACTAPACTSALSCAGVVGPPTLIVQCPAPVDFYQQSASGATAKLDSSVTSESVTTELYADSLLACAPGTLSALSCLSFSEYASQAQWCPAPPPPPPPPTGCGPDCYLRSGKCYCPGSGCLPGKLCQ